MFNSISRICVLSALVILVGDVFSGEIKWTKEQAAAQFHMIMDDDAATGGALVDKIDEWMKKVNDSGVDLGDEGYLLYLGRFILADKAENQNQARIEAVDGLADFVEKNGKLPESANGYAGFFSNTLPQSASKAIDEKKYERAGKLLLAVTAVSGQPDIIYAILGLKLLETEDDKAHEVLNKLLADALVNEKLDTEQKQRILTYIYGDRNEKLAKRRMEEKLDGFVGFEGVDLAGKKVSVDDYKGKVLLVDFWATWCMPCIQEMPNIVEAYSKYKDQGFEILGVSLDPAGKESAVRKTMSDLGMTWSVIYEGKYWESTPAVKNNIISIPAVFLLDRKGKARYADVYRENLPRAIEALLAEKPAGGTENN